MRITRLSHGAIEMGQIDGFVVVVFATIFGVVNGQIHILEVATSHAVRRILVKRLIFGHVVGVVAFDDVQVAFGQTVVIGIDGVSQPIFAVFPVLSDVAIVVDSPNSVLGFSQKQRRRLHNAHHPIRAYMEGRGKNVQIGTTQSPRSTKIGTRNAWNSNSPRTMVENRKKTQTK